MIINGRGAEVIDVLPGSPAQMAGFQVGDLIQAVNGEALSTTNSLETIISRMRPGADATFSVLRGDQPLLLTARLGVAALQSTTTPSDTSLTPLSSPTSTFPPLSANTPSAVSMQAGAVFVQLGFHALIEPGGLRVGEIRQGSPAQHSGLRTGDLIVRVNNQTFNVQDVTGTILPLVTNLRPVLTVMRDGQQITILITPPVTAVTPVPTQIRPPTAVPLLPQRTQLGVAYDVVTAALASQRKLSVDNGAFVTAVVPQSPADVAGIKVGDVITAVDGDKVDAKHTLVFRMMPYNVGDTVTLTVVRGTETLQIPVTLALPGRASNSSG